MITLEMVFDYPPGVAEAVLAAVSPENGGYVEAELRDGSIRFTISGENPATLRNTADDLLACVKSAEASLGISSPASRSEEE